MKQMATATSRKPDRPPALEVAVQNASSTAGVPDDDVIRDWLGYVIDKVGDPARQRRVVTVRIVDEAESRALNREFRQADRPTNVLAFPADAAALPGLPRLDRTELGDLVLCGPVVAREAQAQRKQPADHWAHLLVHGMLHLLGYDHQDTEDAALMESLETELLEGRGIADPYCVG